MPSTSLTQSEAVRRAALLTVQGYDIVLELSESETFRSRTTVRFSAAEPGSDTFAELADAVALTAVLNGDLLPGSAVEGNRIHLAGLAAYNVLVVEATLPCVTSGDGMHRYVDPADDAVYVAAFCGMDLAQRVFACFDQPDLKAPITLTVSAPEAWTVLANGRPLAADDADGGRAVGVRRFATTPPLPPYLFVVCAGPWHSVEWEFRGVPFAWHARRSLASDLDRAMPELRAVTEACFDHYTSVFAEPFGFDSYDQVLVQGLNWGAVETPGCITFRDELLFRGQASPAQRQQRAMIIAHEMAHMWFGDLATLRWWEDAWLNESFADYMGFEVSSTLAGFEDAWTGFTLVEKARGYAADQRRSTHPVAQDRSSVVDTDTAFSNFDNISYAKGNAVLRQLVTWLGDEAFLEGANTYLTRHRWANAELEDFLDALAGATDRDVRRWAQLWLRTTGFDTLRVTREGEVPVLTRDGSRPHRTAVDAYAVEDGRLRKVESRMVDIDADPVSFDDWRGLVVVPNSQDHTFAQVRLDDLSWQAVAEHLATVEDAQVRAVLWSSALDQARTRELSADALLELVGVHLAAEPHSAVWEGVFARTLGLLPFQLTPDGFAAARRSLAEVCTATLRHSESLRASSEQLVLPATRGLAACTFDADLLLRWLEAGRTDAGLPIEPDLRWRVLRRLAELGAIDEQRIEAEALADPSTEADTGAARARAALPTAEAKASAWRLLAADDVPNRVFGATADGFWVPEQAELVSPYVARYLAEAPGWAARRGQGFSIAVGGAFPRLEARAETAAALSDALAGDVPTVLRRAWEDSLDDLRLALRAQE